MSVIELIRCLPKCELHLHIEGSLEPELLMALAKRNDVPISFQSVEEVRQAYRFKDLQSFLDIYYNGASVLLHKQDFADLSFAYMTRAHQDCVRHTEVFFDPQTHTDRGVSFGCVVEGLLEGFNKGAAAYNVSFSLILSFLRHLSEEQGFAVLDTALPFLHHFAGVGLDSSELGHPPEKFKNLFAKCRELGLRCVAHAGEEAPPSYIWGALKELKVERIDHGVQCFRDDELVAHLVAHQIPLTCCPNSNTCLKIFPSYEMGNHISLLRRGLRVTINSDDPAYFGGYIGNNFENLLEQGMTGEEAMQLAMNGFLASWLPEESIRKYCKEVTDVFEAWKAGK